MAAIQVRTQDRQQRCANHHAEGVGADHIADLRFADAQVLGDVGHQTHDRELAGADGETAQCQGQLDQQDRAGRQAWRGGRGVLGHAVLSEGVR
ncbi:hypothetical protein D3C86_1356170 [compost metagenome]